MLGVIPPFCEYLTRKAVPVPIKQCFLICFGKGRETRHIIRVIFHEGGVVKYRTWHKDAVLFALFAVPVWKDNLHRIRYGCHRRCGSNKSVLHPTMPHATGVRRCTHINTRARPIWAVTGNQITVLVIGKVREFIEADEVKRPPLILVLVLFPLHRAKGNACPARKCPSVLGLIELTARKGGRVIFAALVYELRKLWVGLAQDKCPVMRDMYLPEGFDDECFTFPATCRPAV